MQKVLVLAFGLRYLGYFFYPQRRSKCHFLRKYEHTFRQKVPNINQCFLDLNPKLVGLNNVNFIIVIWLIRFAYDLFVFSFFIRHSFIPIQEIFKRASTFSGNSLHLYVFQLIYLIEFFKFNNYGNCLISLKMWLVLK